MYWVSNFVGLVLVIWSFSSYGIDPMAPPGFRGESAKDLQTLPQREVGVRKNQGLVLQQILVRGQHRSAVINDQVVRVGDVIGKGKVEHINKNSVIIKMETGSKVLRVQADYPTIKVVNSTDNRVK